MNIFVQLNRRTDTNGFPVCWCGFELEGHISLVIEVDHEYQYICIMYYDEISLRLSVLHIISKDSHI